MKNLNQRIMANLPFGLPPLGEQRRIVARVDELMRLLDRLEAAHTARDEVRRAARDAALAALRDAKDAEAVEAAWARVSGQMDALFADPEDVAPLRQAICQLAVRGWLVPQAAGETATELVARCVALREKARVSRLPPISAFETPFRLPSGWAWSRVDDICSVVGGVTKGRDLVGRRVKSYPYLRVANVQAGRLALGIIKEIEIPEDEFPQYPPVSTKLSPRPRRPTINQQGARTRNEP
jgi:type I restriction enzyme, S subunit